MPATYRADRNPDRKLRHAAWKGDITLAANLLDRGIDIEGTDADGFTPVLIAARWDRLEMLRFLLDRGGAINKRNRESDSAFNLSVQYKHSAIEAFLQQRGADTSPNSLREGREDDRAEWLAMIKPATPSREEIKQMRKLVHDTYAAMMERKAQDRAEVAISEATGLSPRLAAKHLQKASTEGQVVGQLLFPVGQKVVKKAPKSCKLGVGSMGLALFDGVRPVATWPYKMISGVAASKTKAGGELLISLASGKKSKIVFQTMHAEEMVGHIDDKMQELVGGASPRPAPAAAAASPRAAAGGDGDVSPTAAAGGEGVTTVWVGNIPDTIIKVDMTGSNDFAGDNKLLVDKFGVFGSIVSVTTRLKEGINKCWALITFDGAGAVAAAIAAKVMVPTSVGVDVQLVVEAADVTRHLLKEETGALEIIWRQQQEKKELWFLSLLDGLRQDEDYQNAKAEIAAKLGLRAEELEDELEDQELEGLEGLSLDGIADGMVQDDIEDLEDDLEDEDEGHVADGGPRSLVHSKSDDGYVE